MSGTPALAAKVFPESVSVYNAPVMRIANRTYSQLVLVLSLGLMYSQVCNVICAFSDCSTPASARKSEPPERGGHCHQKQAPSRKEQPQESKHECPAHDSAVSLPPSPTLSTVVSHYLWRIAAAELVCSFDIRLDP